MTSKVDKFDSITLLKAASGKRATKLWTATTIEPYDAGWSFSFQSVNVRDIADLSKLLTKIESDPRTFIIRGQVKPLDEIRGVTPPSKDRPIVTPEGRINRWTEAVIDVPLHSMLIDIDGFQPSGDDPVKDPVHAIEQYIDKHLPHEFAGRSFHWQLSSSAGAPGKKNILKAHVWFWLETPYPSHVLREWANPRRPQVDASPYQPVQVHYTANPLFEEGVVDPVEVRSGFHEGWLDDSVPLVIDEVTFARAATVAENKKTGRDLKDPKEKAGPIGAFHRAFSMQELLETHLAEHFEKGSKGNRLTWTGGNSPEGAFITDDEEHICITNNTSPLKGPINKFDLIRHFMFGHLDEGLDPFEIMVMGDKPSYQAAMTFICSLKEVQAELVNESSGSCESHLNNQVSLKLNKTIEPFRYFKIPEILSTETLKWLVKGVIPQSGLGVLYGESGSGKTFITLDLALSIAQGMEWHNRKVKQAGVLYLAAEGGAGLSKRLEAYAKYHDVNCLNIPFVAVTEPADLLAEGHSRLIATCHEASEELSSNLGLIVIDTLNRSMPGGDENSSQDMGRIVQNASELSRETGAFVLIVHHSGKDQSRGARGHSSLRAAVDTELEVKRNGPIRQLTLTKSRDGRDGVIFAHDLKVVDMGLDEDLDPISSCVAVPGDMANAASSQPKPQGKWQEAVIDSFKPFLSTPLTEMRREELITAIKSKVSEPVEKGKKDRRGESIKTALDALAERGLIVVDAENVQLTAKGTEYINGT